MFTCRDGVSESQFNQVLNIELDQMMQVWILRIKFIKCMLLDIYELGYFLGLGMQVC